MIPQKIGRYEVKSELGRGGMATVYRAYDPSFEREVAVKVLPREFLHDPQFHDRFKREIKTIAALEHPAIVPVHDVGEEEGVPFFVMRYMSGGSLKDQIDRGKFSVADSARIIERLASALAYAHKKGVIHRDLKPDNILFDANGDSYISDFGVASFSSASTGGLTGNAAIGTPAYMSPEQAQGDKVDSRSDIYALGVIIFQMLSGEQPYKAESPMATALKHITDPVPAILESTPDLPEATDMVIKTAMAKNKEDRYPSALELARALRSVATGLEGGQMPTPAAGMTPVSSATMAGSPKPAAPTNQRTLMFAGIGIAVIVIVAVFALKGMNGSGTATPPPVAETTAPFETATPEPIADFFTENFDGNADNWSTFITGGLESSLNSAVQDGHFGFTFTGRDMSAYSIFAPKVYENVRIDMTVLNRGEIRNSVMMICRYHEDKGWYEFDIANNGLFSIRYGKWDAGKTSASYYNIDDGGTQKVLSGKETNTFSVVCNDRALSLFVNGAEVRTVVDNQFVLLDGNIGIGVQSGNLTPVEIWFDSLTVSAP